MKNELIQLAEYLEALEARISDLEQRYDIMMQRSAQADHENALKLNALGAALAEVNARLDDEMNMELEEDEVIDTPVIAPKLATPQPAPKTELEAKPAPAKPVGKHVVDLKQAISLGDRFLFQRELFNQNGELMQKTLEELNKQADFNAAVALLGRKFPTWDKESPTYELFINVLHRRFG